MGGSIIKAYFVSLSLSRLRGPCAYSTDRGSAPLALRVPCGLWGLHAWRAGARGGPARALHTVYRRSPLRRPT